MKPKTLFYSSLIAAAAMSTVPAWADTKTQSGGTGTITEDATYDLIEVKNGGTLNQSSGTVYTTKFQLHNAENTNTDTYNLSGGVLNVTSTTKTESTDVALGHWPKGTGILNVSGTGVLNVTSGLLNISRDGNGTLSISGGEVNAYGITLSPTRSTGYWAGNALLQMTAGRLNIGVGGIIGADASYSGDKTKVVNLSGGTLGALDSWSSSATMTLGGVTIDTTKMSASTTAAASSTSAGATITLSGNITQTAGTTLTVTGAGTLDLSGTTTLNGAVAVSAGLLKISGTSTLNGSVSVDSGATLDLSGASVALSSAITNSGTVTVNSGTTFALSGLTGSTSGNTTTYSLVSGGTLSGWDTLTLSNVDISGTSIVARGATATFSSGSVDITAGTAGDLVWSGGESGNWNYSTDNTPWTISGGSETTSFMYGDNVTFGTENANVAVDSAGVTAGTMTVSAATTLSGTGTVSVAAANLTTTATLTLDSGVTLDLGNLVDGTDVSKNLAGTGTVSISKTSGNHGQTINLGNAFAGTVNYSGNLNPVNATFGSEDATVNFTDVWFWSESSGTIAQKLNFAGTGNKSTNGTLDLTGEITSSAGAEFSLGGGTLNISGASTANIATLKLTGTGSTLNFSGAGTKTIGTLYAQDTDGTNRTISIAEGTTVSVGNITNSWGIKTLTVNGELSVTGTMTYSSGNMTNTITGSGTLTAATFTSANIGTYVFSGELNTNITTLKATKATTTFANTGTNTIGTLYSQVGTINIGDGTNTVAVSATRVEIGDNASGTSTLNVKENATLAITGSNNGNNYKSASLLLSEWNNTTTATISGTLLAKDAKLLRGDYATTLNISGGTLAVKGFYATKNSGNAVTVNVSDSGKLILGSGGVSGITSVNVSLNNGTLAASESTITFSKNIALTGAGTIDTTKYDFASDGKSISQGAESAAIELTGIISGSGALKKIGAGTLKLSGDNSSLSGNVTVEKGTLEAANASALGTGTVTVNEGGVLKISVNGGVNVGEGSVTFNKNAKFAIDLTAYSDVEVDKALSIITASAISFNDRSLGSVTLTSDEIEKYFSADDSDLGDWATGYTRKWGYDTTNSALTLTLITIPEPSTFGLLAGVGALALVAARRRRRAK